MNYMNRSHQDATIKEILGFRPHVSDVVSDQSAHIGHLSHVNSHYHSKVKELQLRPV
jgi:hypothetical protein